MTGNVIERIRAHDADRIPAMLVIKYRTMRGNPFAFYRGSSHLFYEDWPSDSDLNAAPLTWVCGDLHCENFGTYKGENRLVYFDINDFDEGALAPYTWDLARFLTSLYLTGPIMQISEDDSHSLCEHFLKTYFHTLAEGHIHSVERANATGVIRKLIRTLKLRQRSDFLDERTQKAKNQRRFKFLKDRYLPISDEERQQVTEMVQALAKTEKEKKFYRVYDVAFRVAGTGSLGLKRYAALIEGRGSPDENFILDLKEERASALEPYLKTPQPKWDSPAERAIAVQKRIQGMVPALLAAAESANTAYLIREFQPSQDRITLDSLVGKPHAARDLVKTMAEVVAWGQLRSAGRSGSAIADELIEFGEQAALKTELSKYAKRYAQQVKKDFDDFSSAYDAGKLA